MAHRDGFWKLEHLSDAQLLASLASVVHTQCRTLAELVAHLGEVEERRLHLEAACSSMFAYCVGRLGMSEDEACRRIDLARLGRRFPVLFVELESGQITLSVALVLKPILTWENHRELLCAARGRSAQQARELVAERFPKPDAPSSIRKLPERRPAPASEPAPSSPSATPPAGRELAAASLSSPVSATAPMPVTEPTSSVRSEASSQAMAVDAPRPLPPPRPGSVPASRSIEPLSAQRYRIQFTADAELKRKLELARDLLRHAHPSGDFAPIVARALDLLLTDLQRRRFGAGARGRSAGSSAKSAGSPPGSDVSAEVSPPPETSPPAETSPPTETSPPAETSPPTETSPPAAAPSDAACSDTSPSPTAAPRAARSRRPYIPRAVRRTVLEREGLGCSWVDGSGARCGSRAWLELDHCRPVGKDGSSEPDNLRLLCRAHNHFAAEHAYGRARMERARRKRETGRQASD